MSHRSSLNRPQNALRFPLGRTSYHGVCAQLLPIHLVAIAERLHRGFQMAQGPYPNRQLGICRFILTDLDFFPS